MSDLVGNPEDQFSHNKAHISQVSKSEISSIWLASVAVQPGLCQTRFKVIKHFSCSTQQSTKFILLINVRLLTIVGILTFLSRIND